MRSGVVINRGRDLGVQPPRSPFHRLADRRVAGVVLAVVLIAIFGSTLVELGVHAGSHDLHSHIFLVPLVSIYLIYLKRSKLRGAWESSWAAGFAWIGAAVLMVVLGSGEVSTRLSVNDFLAVRVIAFLMAGFGVILLVVGWPRIKRLFFPLAFLVFMVPLPERAVAGFEDLLVVASAWVSHGLFIVSGVPIFRDGQTLEIPGVVLEVARECSGIRSSWVLLITSFIAAYVFLRTPWRRAVLIALVIPLGILRNAFRIWVIGMLCVHYGADMIHGRIHREGGPVFFALSLVPLFLAGWILQRQESRRASIGNQPNVS
jgi:exosortase C (VPDSG-CTERM-specific)